jgi:phospholipid/cholesterol/gamma-HCH transport system permease protein
MATAASIPESKSQTWLARLMQWYVNWITDLGELMLDWMAGLGSISLFGYSMLGWLFTRMPRRETIVPNFYQIGWLSLPVVAITGTFIGMIMAVQTYVQFRMMSMETRLGVVINMSIVRELGPVLAATMLAGRVGSSMAAELGTMRVTEQIDAMASMGANPIQYLVVPRFLACLMLIPALTIVADAMGVAGGYFYSVYILGIDSHHYLINSQRFVGHFDLFAGIFKSLFFGAAIALIGCHRGFNCEPGAEGVGRAATSAFVISFVMIMLLNLLLGIFLDGLYFTFWPEAPKITS